MLKGPTNGCKCISLRPAAKKPCSFSWIQVQNTNWAAEHYFYISYRDHHYFYVFIQATGRLTHLQGKDSTDLGCNPATSQSAGRCSTNWANLAVVDKLEITEGNDHAFPISMVSDWSATSEFAPTADQQKTGLVTWLTIVHRKIPKIRPSKYKPPPPLPPGACTWKLHSTLQSKTSKNSKFPSNYKAGPIDFETQISPEHKPLKKGL